MDQGGGSENVFFFSFRSEIGIYLLMCGFTCRVGIDLFMVAGFGFGLVI